MTEISKGIEKAIVAVWKDDFSSWVEKCSELWGLRRLALNLGENSIAEDLVFLNRLALFREEEPVRDELEYLLSDSGDSFLIWEDED